jgi:hypothetical protein
MLVTELDIDIDFNKLQKEYDLLKIEKLLDDSFNNQLAVQCRPECQPERQLYQGTASLVYDWSKLDENGNPTKLPQIYRQFEFTAISDYFKGTYFEDIIEIVSKKYSVCRTRIMKSTPKTCLSTHSDPTRRIHIPVYTNDDCYMVFTDTVYRLPYGKVYLADTTKTHTAVNASKQSRTHIVMCVNEATQ